MGSNQSILMKLTTVLHTIYYYCLCLHYRSHSGKLVVTGGTGGLLRLWSLQLEPSVALYRAQEARGHSRAILSVAFSLDDKQVVSVGEDGGIFVWSVYA